METNGQKFMFICAVIDYTIINKDCKPIVSGCESVLHSELQTYISYIWYFITTEEIEHHN